MLVIARYNENVDWAKDKEHFIVQKGEQMPNYGREAASFLWYIINHYDELEGDYEFMQGNPFDHWPYVNNPHDCTKRACPHHPGLPWELFNEKSGVELPETFTFHPGGQFVASAKEIKSRSKAFYQNLYDLIYENELIAWILERTWAYVIK
jgi:hypothetical protein